MCPFEDRTAADPSRRAALESLHMSHVERLVEIDPLQPVVLRLQLIQTLGVPTPSSSAALITMLSSLRPRGQPTYTA